MKTRSIGRGVECDLVLNHPSVSRLHAQIEVTDKGFLAIHDRNSSNGTYLQRNDRWIRIRKVILGTTDRIRFGDKEVPLDRLVGLFERHFQVRLREGYSVRGKPLLFDQLLAGLPKPRTVLENPKRNPITGKIEENR